MLGSSELATTPVTPRPKLAVWTPVIPQASGIAAYNCELLLPELARLAELYVVVDDHIGPVADAEAPYTVVRQRAHQAVLDRSVPRIYHIGNHAGFHRVAHDTLLEHPGVVVLHDLSLYDFYRRYHGDGPDFDDEVRHNYGDITGDASSDDPAGGPDRLALPLVRRVVESSRAVIVHSTWARDELSRHFPTTPVFQVPPAASWHEDGDGPDLHGRFGWTEEHVVFWLPAAFAPHKRAAYAVRLFRAVHEVRPETRLIVSGRVDAQRELTSVREAVDAAGIGDAVEILADADTTELDASLAASDAIIDLRWPTAGETPAAVPRAFAAGRPAIVSDLPQLREYDERFCWRVSPDPLLGARTAVQRMIEVASDRVAARDAGRAARAYANDAGYSPESVARRYLEVVDALHEKAHPVSVIAAAGRTPRLRDAVGINVIGDFRATTGLMEAGRRTVSALVGAGAGIELTEFATPADHSSTRAVEELARVPCGRSHRVDLWLLNINEFWLVSEDELGRDGASRYTIGSWFWELPTVPPPFDAQASRVDEIWVGSRFVQDCMSKAAPARTPITIVPCLVDVPAPHPVARSAFGLPEDATIFFFSFDAQSVPARKNPWGVIEAFEQAFDRRERSGPVRLVIKVNNLDAVPLLEEPLRAALDRVNGMLIDVELTRQAMNGLLSSIDVYVSLHRAEGFGLGIAEAMFLGKPVVVTAYSGNLDFTEAANSCLVGYRLRTIQKHDHLLFPDAEGLYQPGLRWAEPSIAQAARWMRFLYDNPDRRRAIGRAGAVTIRARYNRDTVQRALVLRLEEIDRALRERSRSAA